MNSGSNIWSVLVLDSKNEPHFEKEHGGGSLGSFSNTPAKFSAVWTEQGTALTFPTISKTFEMSLKSNQHSVTYILNRKSASPEPKRSYFYICLSST